MFGHNASMDINANATAIAAPTLKWGVLALCMIIIATAVGNLLVCIAVCTEKRLQNMTNYFLMSLAIADFLVAILVMPLGMVVELYGYFSLGTYTCVFWVTMDVLMCTSSIWHMCTMSMDRFFSLKYPMKYGRNKTKTMVALKIMFVWVVSAAICSPLCVLGLIDTTNVLNEGLCVPAIPEFVIYGSMFAFYIPLIIMIVTYALTLRILRQNRQLMKGMEEAVMKKKRKKRRKAIHSAVSAIRYNYSGNELKTMDTELQKEEENNVNVIETVFDSPHEQSSDTVCNGYTRHVPSANVQPPEIEISEDIENSNDPNSGDADAQTEHVAPPKVKRLSASCNDLPSFHVTSCSPKHSQNKTMQQQEFLKIGDQRQFGGSMISPGLSNFYFSTASLNSMLSLYQSQSLLVEDPEMLERYSQIDLEMDECLNLDQDSAGPNSSKQEDESSPEKEGNCETTKNSSTNRQEFRAKSRSDIRFSLSSSHQDISLTINNHLDIHYPQTNAGVAKI